jgi:alkylation response protein AidB-like acyl-CoA dehydrogenase
MPETMGCRGGYHGILEFNNCEVPVENILGVEGKGIDDAVRALRVSRIYIAANAVGVCERCLELSLKRAKERVTFGKPIADRQAIQGYLAEMASDTYSARVTMVDAARKVDEKGEPGVEADLCKLVAVEAVKRVTDTAMLVHGGLGYTREFPISRLYRDSRLNWLEEGTPTIHKFEAARHLLRNQFSGDSSYTF